MWAVPRGEILGAEVVEQGIRLRLLRNEAATLTAFIPPARRDEFAAALAAAP